MTTKKTNLTAVNSKVEDQLQQEATENAVPNMEMAAGLGIMSVKEARAKLETDGLEEAAKLGVDPKAARRIIDKALAVFDAHTQGSEDASGADPLAALLGAVS